MIVYIYSDELMYCGANGMYNCGVYDIDSIDEANEIGRELAYDVVESYNCLSEEYDYNDEEDMEALDESLRWIIWAIAPEVQMKMSIDDLMKESASLDRDSFVDMYCGERID